MRFTTAATIVAVSALTLLTSTTHAALTPAERAEIELKEGSNPNFCPPCLQKAMHNHFPHACERDLDPMEANERPTGATDKEERCLCVSFQDLFWMKADCSAECTYVYNQKMMSYFLPASKIEGCDNWIDFETGMEKDRTAEGFAMLPQDHSPEIFEIVPPPAKAEGADEEDDEEETGYKVSVKITTEEDDKKKALELEGKEQEEEKVEAEKKEEKVESKDEL